MLRFSREPLKDGGRLGGFVRFGVFLGIMAENTGKRLKETPHISGVCFFFWFFFGRKGFRST